MLTKNQKATLVAIATVVLSITLSPGSYIYAQSDSQVTLHFYSWLDPEFVDKYVDFANNYMQERYSNVVVNHTSLGVEGGYTEKLLLAIAAGSGPDIYFFNLGNFNPEWVEENLMLQIDRFLDADPDYKKDFPPALLDAWRYEGKLYGLPTTIGQYAVYFNRDHFAEAGLERPSPDWTIRGEFRSKIEKLFRVDSQGVPQRYGLPLQTNLKGRFMNYVLSDGGHVVDEKVTKARISEPEFVGIVEFFKNLADTGVISPESSTGRAYRRFVAGEVSMLMTGIFYQSRVTNHSQFDWGVARIPRGRAGRKTCANTNAWVINPSSRHVEFAWELAKGFSSAEFTKYALEEGLEFPVALSALEEYFFDTLPPNLTREEGKIWLEAMNYITPYPKHHLMPDIWRISQSQINKVWRDDIAPRTAAQIAAEQINALIRQKSGK